MNRPILLIFAAILGFLGLSSVFIVNETEYAIKFQLGRILRADYEPGLHFKVPFFNNVRKFDRRILTLDTPSELMLTSEQKFVNVDSFVKWRIRDVSKFYISTQGNELLALNRLIAQDHAVTVRWITDAELEAAPELVRTMSVKPPSGAGRVRLLDIEGVDLQPCGGTHVARTGEIGAVEITRIENKGRQNRRINIAFKA